jgi:predicted DNA-binding transcriptional regulator AlpA
VLDFYECKSCTPETSRKPAAAGDEFQEVHNMSNTTIRKSEPDNTVRTLPQSIGSEKKQATTTTDRIVRPAEQVIITGRSLASIWRDQQNGTYPPNVRIGQNAVGVRLSSLMAWLDSREVITADNVIPICPGSARGRKSSTKGGK